MSRDNPSFAQAARLRMNEARELADQLRTSLQDHKRSDHPAKEAGSRSSSLAPRASNGALAGRGVTLERLAAELAIVGRPVVDRTGLDGKFDFDVEWMPDEQQGNVDLFRALRERLGLKLQSARAPMEVIVIESAAKPAEN